MFFIRVGIILEYIIDLFASKINFCLSHERNVNTASWKNNIE